MSDPALWQQANTQYLSSAVAALRARLERLAVPPSPSPPPRVLPAPKEEPRSFWQQLVGRGAAEPAVAAALPPPRSAPSEENALGSRPAAEPTVPPPTIPPPALVLLGQRLGLSQF